MPAQRTIDPRSRLRPLIYSGVTFKIEHAIDELARLDDPALYDWFLQSCRVHAQEISTAWNWKHDGVCILRHPTLEPDVAMRVLARAQTPLATKLKGELTSLGIELGFNRRDEPYLDVSSLSGMPAVTKLRILARDPQNVWDWRHAMSTSGPAKPLRGFSAICALHSLEHLTIIGAAGLDLTVLATLPRLSYLELVACDLVETAPLADSAIRELVIASCHALRSLELPAQLAALHLDDLPALASLGGVPAMLHTVEITGTPELVAPGVEVSAQRKMRRAFERF